jgi:hypothetical protein
MFFVTLIISFIISSAGRACYVYAVWIYSIAIQTKIVGL